MKKVFIGDFDGTYYYHLSEDKRRLPEENLAKIREFQAAGNLFGLCTARQVGVLTHFLEGIVSPDFYITSSGANIVDDHLREIRKKGIDPNVVDAILRHYGPDKYRFTLDVEGRICVFQEMDFPGEYFVITGVDDAPRGLIHHVSIHTQSPEEAAAMAEEINLWYGDSVRVTQNVIQVDIAPVACSKREAVQFMREYISQTYGEIRLYGIGDALNDVPFLAATDVSYTYTGAPEKLRERVTKVVDTLADALEDSMNEQA